MKILIFDLYRESFLRKFYEKHPEIANADFQSQKDALLATCYSPLYSYYLKQQGYDVEDVITNDVLMQLQWAREEGLKVYPLSSLATKVTNRFLGIDWRFKILKAQIKKAKPDVLFIHERNILTDGFIDEIRPFVKFIVCLIASPIQSGRNFKSVDLILTSLPNFVSYFRENGLKSEYLAWGFDSRVLDQLQNGHNDRSITFIGGIYRAHQKRQQLLESLSRKMPIEWFGYDNRAQKANSSLTACYRGEVWGLDMYRTLLESRLTINCHIDESRDYANNQRLFEATGVGTCLLTDWKKNIGDFFEPDKEIVVYRNENELVEKLRYFIDHEKERKQIAKAGQDRTLRDHTLEKRALQMMKIIERYFRG